MNDFIITVDSSSTASQYIGRANDYIYLNSHPESDVGTVWDADIRRLSDAYTIGVDAYDIFGNIGAVSDRATGAAYSSQFNGLTGNRQTQTISTGLNVSPTAVRWFDSFTNNTASTITANIRFAGNLGSDGNTNILAQGAGYIISNEGNTSTNSDPTVLQIYSDANYASQVGINHSIGSDLFSYDYLIEVAPGQTASILFASFVFADIARTLYSSNPEAVEREKQAAINAAISFINSPIFTGLTADQIATIVNFGVKLKLDGTLPSAAVGSRIAGNALTLFNNLLDLHQSFAGAGAQLAQGDIAPMAYVPLTSIGTASDGAAQIASMINQSGGRLRAGNDHHELFMLGGFTRGSDRSLSETMSYKGYALALGYEFAADNDSQYGIVAGYMNTSGEMGETYRDISGEQYLISPYARWNAANDILFDARVSLSSDNWEYLRKAGALDASAVYDGYSLGASLQASKAIDTAIATVTPFAKVAFSHSHFNAYQEQGAGSANLDIPSYRVNAAEALVGVGLSNSWQLDDQQTVSVFSRLGLGKGFGSDKTIDTTYVGSSTTYATVLEGKDDIFGRLDLGASMQLTKSTDVTLSYSGTFTDEAAQHSLSSKLRIQF